METLYSAMPLSPATELSAGIDDTQTTIPVVDASKLPDAPNLATIGTNEDAEVILYTGKDNNDLTGCTREVVGVAKSWDAGTQTARLFTSKDLNDLQGNLNEHLGNTAPHSATADATPNRLMLRDANGRAKVDAPSAADDIARLDSITKDQVGLGDVENYRQARSLDGYEIQKDGSDAAGIINFKTS